ncbi:hypothetical protein ACLB2K_017358 [Fragaria x ananassa]
MYLGVSGLLTKGKISLKNLRDRFINAEDTDYYTRAYLLYVIGSFIVPDKTRRSVDVMFLEQLKDIDKIGTFAWGAALLAHLHVELETASESSLAGHSYSLMIWAFLHIPKLLKLLPNTGRKGPDEFPLLVQWTNWLSLDLKNNFHKNLKSKFSDILDNLKDEDYGIDKPEYSGVRKEIAIYKKQRKLSGEIDWSKYTSEKGKVDYSKYIQEWKHRSESLLKEALGVEEHSGPTLSSTPSSIGNVRYDCSNTHFEDDEPEVEPLQPPPSEDATPQTQADASPKTPDDDHGSGGEEITWNTFYLAFSGQANPNQQKEDGDDVFSDSEGEESGDRKGRLAEANIKAGTMSPDHSSNTTGKQMETSAQTVDNPGNGSSQKQTSDRAGNSGVEDIRAIAADASVFSFGDEDFDSE